MEAYYHSTAYVEKEKTMIDKPRSAEQHRRFFAMVRALYHHWPEAIEFHPDSEEHLRAYLLVKAKYRTIKTFYMTSDDAADECAKVVPIVTAMMLHRYCWCWTDGNALHIVAPESMSFDKLPHAKACAVFSAVEDYVRSIGMDPDQVLKETESAA